MLTHTRIRSVKFVWFFLITLKRQASNSDVRRTTRSNLSLRLSALRKIEFAALRKFAQVSSWSFSTIAIHLASPLPAKAMHRNVTTTQRSFRRQGQRWQSAVKLPHVRWESGRSGLIRHGLSNLHSRGFDCCLV